MPEPRAHGLPSPTVCAVIVVGILAMIVIPAAFTLRTVHSPVPPIPVSQALTPYGYTVSLLLFIVPVAFIAVWFLPSEGLHVSQRAFWWTIATLVPFGFVLDLVSRSGSSNIATQEQRWASTPSRSAGRFRSKSTFST